MNQSVVAVIDGARARFFLLEPVEFPEYQSGPNLVEQSCLTNTSNEVQGKELWANTKSGRNGGSGNQGHGYDDHRQKHLTEFERSFAKEIATTILEIIQQNTVHHAVLVAEPQILGLIREVLLPQLPKQLNVEELAKDLCKLKPQELHEYLAERGILAARKAAIG